MFRRDRVDGCTRQMGGHLAHDFFRGGGVHVARAPRDMGCEEHIGQFAQRIGGGRRLVFIGIQRAKMSPVSKPARKKRPGRGPGDVDRRPGRSLAIRQRAENAECFR